MPRARLEDTRFGFFNSIVQRSPSPLQPGNTKVYRTPEISPPVAARAGAVARRAKCQESSGMADGTAPGGLPRLLFFSTRQRMASAKHSLDLVQDSSRRSRVRASDRKDLRYPHYESRTNVVLDHLDPRELQGWSGVPCLGGNAQRQPYTIHQTPTSE